MSTPMLAMTDKITPDDVEILNETAYSTDDLRDLFRKVYDTLTGDLQTIKGLRIHRMYCAPLRESIRIGYYKPRTVSKISYLLEDGLNYAEVPRLVSATDNYKPSMRIGILQINRMFDNALTALAAASGDDLTIPTVGVIQIAMAMVEALDCYPSAIRVRGHVTRYRQPPEEDHPAYEHWDWLRTFKLRHTKGAGAAAKRSARAAAVETSLNNLNQQIIWKREKLEQLANQMEKEQEKLEKMFTRRIKLRDKLSKLRAGNDAVKVSNKV